MIFLSKTILITSEQICPKWKNIIISIGKENPHTVYDKRGRHKQIYPAVWVHCNKHITVWIGGKMRGKRCGFQEQLYQEEESLQLTGVTKSKKKKTSRRME